MYCSSGGSFSMGGKQRPETIESLKKKLEARDRELRQKEVDIENLRENYRCARRSAETEKQDYFRVLSMMKWDLALSQSKVHELIESKKRMAEEIELEKKMCKELKETNYLVNERVQKLEIEAFENKESTRKQLEEANRDLETKNKQIQELQEKLTKAEKEKNAEIEVQDKEAIESLKEKLKARDEELRDRDLQTQKLIADNQNHIHVLAKMEQELTNCKAKLAEEEEMVKDLQRENTRQEDQIWDANNKIQSLEKQLIDNKEAERKTLEGIEKEFLETLEFKKNQVLELEEKLKRAEKKCDMGLEAYNLLVDIHNETIDKMEKENKEILEKTTRKYVDELSNIKKTLEEARMAHGDELKKKDEEIENLHLEIGKLYMKGQTAEQNLEEITRRVLNLNISEGLETYQ